VRCTHTLCIVDKIFIRGLGIYHSLSPWLDMQFESVSLPRAEGSAHAVE